jgi:DNA-binding MarR family transcriptional regulator
MGRGGSVDAALAGYKAMHRAMLNSTARRWQHLDISMQQLRALYFLRDEEVATVGRLAEFFDVGLPAASLLADRLVRAGLVERRGDTVDRRRVLLSLSRSGLVLVTELREGSHLLLRRWMARLSAEDLDALSRGWRALAEVAAHHGQALEHVSG